MPHEPTAKAYTLLRAEWLLSPQAAVRPRRDHIWLASAAFACSGLVLGFIMLMGVGYDGQNHADDQRQRIPMGEVETEIVNHLDQSGVVEAIPLRDEDGQPLPR